MPYFIHITLNDSGEVSSGGMYSNKNRRIHTDRTPSPHTMSICVYLLKRLTICNDVYNSHPRCEGSTVNISSTSDSVFEVCYEFCARFFVCFGGFFYRTEDAFVHHLTNRDLKNIFVAIVWDLYYIYFPNPDENAFLTMALEALYKLEIFISYHLAVFCHFYMFVMNKLFYSECIRLKEC